VGDRCDNLADIRKIPADNKGKKVGGSKDAPAVVSTKAAKASAATASRHC
jgi:hypothetical protein